VAIPHQPPSLLFTGWLTTELPHLPTSYFISLHSTELLTTARLVFLLYNLVVDPTENTTSNNCSNVVMASCLEVDWISFPWERIYWPLPTNGCCLSASCIATAALIGFEGSVQQQVYMPQYHHQIPLELIQEHWKYIIMMMYSVLYFCVTWCILIVMKMPCLFTCSLNVFKDFIMGILFKFS
jgi:hypothetical protein